MRKDGKPMEELHLPHQHEDAQTMQQLHESVETVGSFQTVSTDS